MNIAEDRKAFKEKNQYNETTSFLLTFFALAYTTLDGKNLQKVSKYNVFFLVFIDFNCN